MMQTNIPALVCLSMIVSGCANDDLFNNWNKFTDGSISNLDKKAPDLSTCDGPCPPAPVWTEDFSDGLSLVAGSTSSVWKTANATWIFEHTGNPENSAPVVSWSICDRDATTIGLCKKSMPPGKLSFVSLGGISAKSCSAVAYFQKTIRLSNVGISLAPKVSPCTKKNPPIQNDPCNSDMSPLMNGNSELRIETVPFRTLVQQYHCTSSACEPVPQSSLPNNDIYVEGMRITYSKKDSAANYEYLNFTVDSLTLTGTYQ